MSKEPAEIFERAAEDGFIAQLKHHSTVSQYGQLSGALALDGTAAREHFKHILHNQVSLECRTESCAYSTGTIGPQRQVLRRVQQDRRRSREGGRCKPAEPAVQEVGGD